MRAVANVVMNRVNSQYGEYARVEEGSIRNIIFQPGQFTCAMEYKNGKYNAQNIYNMRPDDTHYAIVDWAMSGQKLPGFEFALWFFNPYSPKCRDFFPSAVGVFTQKLGDHCFYNPTDDYYET